MYIDLPCAFSTYYLAGAQRVAVRERYPQGFGADKVSYLLSDHLGSTSVTADADGNLRSRTLYSAWGEVRHQAGALPTDYTYTGQYSNTADFGLMYYRARWYDPSLGRFSQADTIVPGAGNPMAWDRYAYVNNNAINAVDPSGHFCVASKSGGQTCSADDDVTVIPKRPSQVTTWKDHPRKDDWGDPDNSDNEWDMERAETVWKWLCQSGGYWGSGCPSAYELTVWLFWQESGELLNDDIYYITKYTQFNRAAVRASRLMVTYIHWRLSDGIDPRADLGKFTAFFNPNSGSSFNAADWQDLMTQPPSAAYNTVDAFWNTPYDYPGQELMWKTPNESYVPDYPNVLVEVKDPRFPKNPPTILILGLK